jgi:hypothetical protein
LGAYTSAFKKGDAMQLKIFSWLLLAGVLFVRIVFEVYQGILEEKLTRVLSLIFSDHIERRKKV